MNIEVCVVKTETALIVDQYGATRVVELYKRIGFGRTDTISRIDKVYIR